VDLTCTKKFEKYYLMAIEGHYWTTSKQAFLDDVTVCLAFLRLQANATPTSPEKHPKIPRERGQRNRPKMSP
jgi:hypothetical protein